MCYEIKPIKKGTCRGCLNNREITKSFELCESCDQKELERYNDCLQSLFEYAQRLTVKNMKFGALDAIRLAEKLSQRIWNDSEFDHQDDLMLDRLLSNLKTMRLQDERITL